MEIVDTHVHASPYWYEPIETILDQMNRNGVAKAALIQHRGQYDNSYLIECVRRFPGRFSAVAVIDTDREDAPGVLEKLSAEGVEGLRMEPSIRSPGGDPLALWRKASDLGMVISSGLGTPEEYASAEFNDLVQQLPELPIVIEHLGFVRQAAKPPYATFRRILSLSKYPNVYMKFHGLGEICPRLSPMTQPFPFGDVPPLIEMAYDAFGATKLMWGSDFPPVAGREGYRNALRLPMERIPFRSEEDKEWAFGRTASTLWKFEG